MSGTFSQQLEDLLNPQPKFIDPEDDGDEETKAKVIEKFDEDEEEEEEDGHGRVEPSALRKHAASLLSDTDRRYAGKAVSRKQLLQDSEEEEEGDDDEEEEEEECEEEGEDDDNEEEEEEKSEGEEELQESDKDYNLNDDGDDLNDSGVTFPKAVDFRKLTEGMDDLGVSEDEDDEDEEDEEESEGEEGESSVEDDSEQEDYDNSTVQTFSQDKVNEEVEKGQAVKNQLALWDQLLEGRIKFQKALVSANQLPQPPTFPEFKKNADFAGALKNSHKALKALQRSLLELQDELLVQSADTRAISLGEQSDEEIISDEDCGVEQKRKKPQKRKLEMAEYADVMAKRFAAFTPYQNATLQKWHDKTRLTMGKTSKAFGAFDRNVLTQIEQVLMDKDRLIKRTQTRRSEYKVMGKKEGALISESATVEGEEPEKELKTNSHLKDLDEDIFDDDDFYHQLLRELIERKTNAADPNDQVAMGRQWLAIQKLRSKIKKKVDTKASKGRKVRFHIHSKLVNFMAPMDHSAMADEAKSELYRGLFGQKSTTRE